MNLTGFGASGRGLAKIDPKIYAAAQCDAAALPEKRDIESLQEALKKEMTRPHGPASRERIEDLKRRIAVAKGQKDSSTYVVTSPCRAYGSNYDVTLSKGEKLTWLGTDSSGSMYKRANGERVTVSRDYDERCIQLVR